MKKLFLGEHKSGKTESIKSFYLEAINNGVSSSQMIIFTRNKTLESQIKESIFLSTNKTLEKVNIFRFRAFVNHIISNYWYLLLNNQPNFIGFSESILLMQEFVKSCSEKFSNNYSDKYILIKLFERQQRRAENNLSFIELKDRTSNLENNSLIKEADLFLELYNNWLLAREKPFFDYAIQLDFFYKLIEIPDVRSAIIRDFKHAWLIDDIEDAIPAEHHFYELFWNDISNIIYTGNLYGGVRQFLGSDPEYIHELRNKIDQVITLQQPNNLLYDLGKAFYDDIFYEGATDQIFDDEIKLKDNFKLINSVSYSRMLEDLNQLWFELKKNNIDPQDIIIVTCQASEQLNLEVESQLKSVGWSSEAIKGSHIIAKNPLINVLITFMRIIFDQEIKVDDKIPALTSFDFCQLIHIVGNVDNFYLAKLRKNLKNDVQAWINYINEFSQKSGYKTLKIINDLLIYSFEQKDNLKEPSDYTEMFYYMAKKLLWNSEKFRDSSSLADFRLFLIMLQKHLDINSLFFDGNPLLHFIEQIIKGELSDNPDREIEFKDKKVKIITIQKLSEIKYSTPIQIWIDISSERWIQGEITPLINAALFSKRRDLKKIWSFHEEDQLTKESLAKSMRISLSLCQKYAYFLSCDYGIMGENKDFGMIKNFLSNL
ncbi:MAG: hypothetical protein H7263_11365 [Candidatus Sericytochromatia bacterium]|nr:hypothetical protein [Candidatus Sericytochromatia bacterium]